MQKSKSNNTYNINNHTHTTKYIPRQNNQTVYMDINEYELIYK
jgi:hypothetical protein